MLFETALDYYQAIANELSEAIREPWASIRVEAERFIDSIEISVVYTRLDGSTESDVNQIMLAEFFYELAEVISTKENGYYKKCFFLLSSDGNFDVNFEY